MVESDLVCFTCGSLVQQTSCLSCRRKIRSYKCQKCGALIANPEYAKNVGQMTVLQGGKCRKGDLIKS